MKKMCFAFMAVAVLMTLATTAFAGGREPGSLLVFPIYDSREGITTLITVTNTHPTEAVWVEYRYIDGETCAKSDVHELLTPNDTITVVAFAHNFQRNQGYVYVFAEDSQGGPPIVHNWLIGQASSFDGIRTLEYSYNAYSFLGVGNHGDLNDDDNDGVRDFDGVEYEMLPDLILHPRFIGQADGQFPGFISELVLINLTGGTQFDAEINFWIYNDNERLMSQTYSFFCWDRQFLLDISGAFSATFLKQNDDDDEIVGFPELEAGWFTIDGIVANSDCTSIEDPAILSLLVETTGRTFAGADLPFQTGTQDNGDLLPRGCFGDT